MFSPGAKEVVCNQMHARVPNQLFRRNQWVNLCIDVASFVNECFTQKGTPGQNFKCIEQIQLEGSMKLRKVFTSRS